MTNEQINAQPNQQDFQAAATKVSVISMATNVILTVAKFAAGVVAHSGAMISDAVHSASDIFSGLIVLIGVRISSKAPAMNALNAWRHCCCPASWRWWAEPSA